MAREMIGTAGWDHPLFMGGSNPNIPELGNHEESAYNNPPGGDTTQEAFKSLPPGDGGDTTQEAFKSLPPGGGDEPMPHKADSEYVPEGALPIGQTTNQSSVGDDLKNYKGVSSPAGPTGPVTSGGHMGGVPVDFHGDEKLFKGSARGGAGGGVISPESDYETSRGNGYYDPNTKEPYAGDASSLDRERARYAKMDPNATVTSPVGGSTSARAALEGFDTMHPKGDYTYLDGAEGSTVIPKGSKDESLGPDHVRNQLNATLLSQQGGGRKATVGDASAGRSTAGQTAFNTQHKVLLQDAIRHGYNPNIVANPNGGPPIRINTSGPDLPDLVPGDPDQPIKKD